MTNFKFMKETLTKTGLIGYVWSKTAALTVEILHKYGIIPAVSDVQEIFKEKEQQLRDELNSRYAYNSEFVDPLTKKIALNTQEIEEKIIDLCRHKNNRLSEFKIFIL